MSAPDLTSENEHASIARRFLDAGIVPPPDRAAGAYAAAQRLLEAVHYLRKARSSAIEPAHVFALTPNEEANS